MTGLTVLSPHRDDAVFSTCFCLAKWIALPIKVRVVNFFVRSAYAPYASTDDPVEISAVRKNEDRRAIRKISDRIEVVDGDMVDAPIRLGIQAHSVCHLDAGRYLTDELIRQIGRFVNRSRAELRLAPAGLGNHVDHLAVCTAAIRHSPPGTLAFYEDLPYATWTSDQQLKSRLLRIEEMVGLKLRPVTVKSLGWWKKRRAAAQYSSQISLSEAEAIARWSSRFQGGERIWVPRYSESWRFMK